jgi:hypothetical protein
LPPAVLVSDLTCAPLLNRSRVAPGETPKTSSIRLLVTSVMLSPWVPESDAASSRTWVGAAALVRIVTLSAGLGWLIVPNWSICCAV